MGETETLVTADTYSLSEGAGATGQGRRIHSHAALSPPQLTLTRGHDGRTHTHARGHAPHKPLARVAEGHGALALRG